MLISLTDFDRPRVAVSCQKPNPFRRDNFPEEWIRADRIHYDRAEHRLRQREGKVEEKAQGLSLFLWDLGRYASFCGNEEIDR